jgi:ankyrin repeat protein
VAQRLIQKGADLELRIHSLGWSALMIAVCFDNHDIVRELLRAGADANVRDHEVSQFCFFEKA